MAFHLIKSVDVFSSSSPLRVEVLWLGSVCRACAESYTVHQKDLDMPNNILNRPDLRVFTDLDCLGLEATGHRIEPAHAVLAYRISGDDRRIQTPTRPPITKSLFRPTCVHL